MGHGLACMHGCPSYLQGTNVDAFKFRGAEWNDSKLEAQIDDGLHGLVRAQPLCRVQIL